MERSTRQRRAIVAAFQEAGRPLSPNEVLELAGDDVTTLGLSTVYRTLKRLTEDGTLAIVELPGDAARYELAHAAAQHHHHFRCDSCGKVYDIHGCSGDVESIAPAGFKVTGHEITLVGLCADCAAA
ncbi:MAG: transcriptional repressor [Planctomycetota bacterium]